MPRKKSLRSSVLPLVEEFASRLASFIEEHSVTRAREAVMAAFGVGAAGTRAGRATGSGHAAAAPARRKRRKGPIQYCPVPGCKNRAAPVFGMVCADHRKVPKAQIKKYRDARRAAKLKAAT